jgi:hypothetical protein
MNDCNVLIQISFSVGLSELTEIQAQADLVRFRSVHFGTSVFRLLLFVCFNNKTKKARWH